MNTSYSSSFIDSLDIALKQSKYFYFEDGQFHKMGLCSRIWHRKDSSFHQARYKKVMDVLSEVLYQFPRLSPKEANEYKTIRVARAFFKLISKEYPIDLLDNHFYKELIAARLGITTRLMDHNPGFISFIHQNILINYLIAYDHDLRVNEEAQEIMILKNGEFCKWNEISEEVANYQETTQPPKQAWRYGLNGIKNEDMYQWKELKPFKIDNSEKWGFQYGLEICTCCEEQPRKVGDHTWLRLYTPEGEIYSVGLYRLGKHAKSSRLPLEVKKGHLMMPDVSEFWNVPIQTIFSAITKEQFEKIKEEIEKDKELEEKNEIVFQLLRKNCTRYVLKKSRIAGIRFDSQVPSSFFFTSKSYRRFFNKLPTSLQTVGEKISTIFWNLIQVLLGGTKVEQGIPKNPNIRSVRDIFRSSKHHFHSPYKLANEIRPEVEAWRIERASKLRKRGESNEFIDRIQFTLPKKFLI